MDAIIAAFEIIRWLWIAYCLTVIVLVGAAVLERPR
jgi:hypothetical protein